MKTYRLRLTRTIRQEREIEVPAETLAEAKERSHFYADLSPDRWTFVEEVERKVEEAKENGHD